MQFCPPWQGRVAPRWSAEQTERRRGEKGRDYCGQYRHRQTPLQPPTPRTLGLQASYKISQQEIFIRGNVLKEKIIAIIHVGLANDYR